MDHDPYREWLGLAPCVEPRNHYQLLGLRDQTVGKAEIEAAYERSFSKVRQYEIGSFREQATSILHELSEAYTCLSDRGLRAKYDAELRSEPSSRDTRIDAPSARDTHRHRDAPSARDTTRGDGHSGDGEGREFDSVGAEPVGAWSSSGDEDAFALAAALERTAKVEPTANPLTNAFEATSPEFVPERHEEQDVGRRLASVGLVTAGVLLAIAFAVPVGWYAFGRVSPSTLERGVSVGPGAVASGTGETSQLGNGDGSGLLSVVSDQTPPIAPEGVEVVGGLLRVLTYDADGPQPTTHLLVSGPSVTEPMEAYVRDPRLVQELSALETAAENPASLTVVRCVLDSTTPGRAGEFVSPRFTAVPGPLAQLVAVTSLNGTPAASGPAASGPDVSGPGTNDAVDPVVDSNQRFAELRQVGRLTEVPAELVQLTGSEMRYAFFRLGERRFIARLAKAWSTVCERHGNGVTRVVIRTTDQFQRDPVYATEPFGHLELVGFASPHASQLARQPGLGSVSGFPYQARLASWSREGDRYRFWLQILDTQTVDTQILDKTGNGVLELEGRLGVGGHPFFSQLPANSEVMARLRVTETGKIALAALGDLRSSVTEADFLADDVAVSDSPSTPTDMPVDIPPDSLLDMPEGPSNSGKSAVPTTTGSPSRTVAPGAKASVPTTAGSVPSAIDLPAKEVEGWQPLFPWELNSSEVQLELESVLANLPTGQRFVVNPVEGRSDAWRIVQRAVADGSSGEPVAFLKYESGEMWFQWRKTPAAGTVPGQLRNCLLRCRVGGTTEEVLLRTCVKTEVLPLVHSDDGKNSVFDLPDLPRAESLECQVFIDQGSNLAQLSGLGKRLEHSLDSDVGLLAAVTCRVVEGRRLVVVSGLVEASQRTAFLSDKSLQAAANRIKMGMQRSERDIDEAIAEQNAAQTRSENIRSTKRKYDLAIVASKARAISTLREGIVRMQARLEELENLHSSLDQYVDCQVRIRLQTRGLPRTVVLFEAGMIDD